jgi:hypothetical protein
MLSMIEYAEMRKMASGANGVNSVIALPSRLHVARESNSEPELVLLLARTENA